ncbi:hypothetical protein [Mucilaginibacter aquariorum]|uniref:Uncharacterized protein n=1 Tax=Mucilaginibacter aquariorum TaxID=2967225 RepID=A0ABT1T910_9SPHI|nr:hypothetical protein [Mucilaginibacter aquariorum]MCQ6961090.1 hypothetical protein [Mucilaginibacter aquariorum]
MKSYWSEEKIMTANRTYIKGTFRGKYHAQRIDELSRAKTEFFDMHVYDVEVILEQVRSNAEGDFPENKSLETFSGTFAQSVNCYDPKSKSFFKLNISEPKIADPQISLVTKEGTEQLGSISGTLYGSLLEMKETIVRKEHFIPDPVAPPTGAIPLSNHPDWTRTAGHEFSYIGGTRYRRDQYRYHTGSLHWGNWYTVRNNRVTTGSAFGLLGGILLCIFLLFFLISLSWPGIIFIGIILLILLISRLTNRRFSTVFSSVIYILFFLFYFGGLAVSVFRGSKIVPAKTPVHQPDTRDYSRTKPVKKPAVNTNLDTTAADQWIIHHRAWEDLSGNQYEGDVRVLTSAFRAAENEHLRMKGVSSLSDVYRNMSLSDENRMQGIYPLFDSLRKARNLDEANFAGMLVSFVQDIPYNTITDGTCSSDNTDLLSASPAGNIAGCLGHVPYGVQSPVEFMANFQGDCDTRTLFLFTVLNHYHYKVAIAGSNAFRHSLLGIDLPLPGSAKTAGQDRYVLWETTSRGFSPGQLRPEIDHMDYWEINLINKPSI